jgi:hypothetical protein
VPQYKSGRRGEEKILPLPGLELLPIDRPVRSQSLYRLLVSKTSLRMRRHHTVTYPFIRKSLDFATNPTMGMKITVPEMLNTWGLPFREVAYSRYDVPLMMM